METTIEKVKVTYSNGRGKYGRQYAFIQPDKDLVAKRGIEVYIRLNMPDEDRERSMKWLGISELKHT